MLITDHAAYKYLIQHAVFKVGPGPTNLDLKGEDTTVQGTAHQGALCVARLNSFRFHGRNLDTPRVGKHKKAS